MSKKHVNSKFIANLSVEETLDTVSEHDMIDMSSYPVDAPNVSRQTIRFPSALDTTPRLSDHDPSR